MQIVINYQSRARSFKVTPSQKVPVKRLAKKSYPSFAASVIEKHTSKVIKAVGKKIHEEMGCLSSDAANPILKDDRDEIMNFSWSKVYSEFQKLAPCLIDF